MTTLRCSGDGSPDTDAAEPLPAGPWAETISTTNPRTSSSTGASGVTKTRPRGSPSIRERSWHAVASSATTTVRHPCDARSVITCRTAAAWAGLARSGSRSRPQTTTAAAWLRMATAAASASAVAAASVTRAATSAGAASGTASGRWIAGSNANTMSATGVTSIQGRTGPRSSRGRSVARGNTGKMGAM